MALILDTGPLVALVDRGDLDHDRCREIINAATEVRIVPVCTLVDSVELARATALVDEYDLPLGFVDATVLACVERLGEAKLATLDRRPSP